MSFTHEELQESIKRLRERRMAIPELRDYKPKQKSKSTKQPKAEIEDFDSFFGGLGGSQTTEKGGDS